MVVQVPCLHQTRCLLLVCTYLLSTQLHVKELRELDKYRKLLEDQKNIYTSRPTTGGGGCYDNHFVAVGCIGVIGPLGFKLESRPSASRVGAVCIFNM